MMISSRAVPRKSANSGTASSCRRVKSKSRTIPSIGYLLDAGSGAEPRPLSRSAPGGVAQGSEDTNADRQKSGGDAQRKQGIAGHEVPALPHKLNDGIHSGQYGGHPGSGSDSLDAPSFLKKSWLRELDSNQRSPGREPGELDRFSIPRYGKMRFQGPNGFMRSNKTVNQILYQPRGPTGNSLGNRQQVRQKMIYSPAWYVPACRAFSARTLETHFQKMLICSQNGSISEGRKPGSGSRGFGGFSGVSFIASTPSHW